jgi:hypothetical protein
MNHRHPLRHPRPSHPVRPVHHPVIPQPLRIIVATPRTLGDTRGRVKRSGDIRTIRAATREHRPPSAAPNPLRPQGAAPHTPSSCTGARLPPIPQQPPLAALHHELLVRRTQARPRRQLAHPPPASPRPTLDVHAHHARTLPRRQTKASPGRREPTRPATPTLHSRQAAGDLPRGLDNRTGPPAATHLGPPPLPPPTPRPIRRIIRPHRSPRGPPRTDSRAPSGRTAPTRPPPQRSPPSTPTLRQRRLEPDKMLRLAVLPVEVAEGHR